MTCVHGSISTASHAGISRPNQRRTAESTRCSIAAELLALEHEALVDIFLAPARPFPAREFMMFSRAQERRMQHEQNCPVCLREVAA
jgi:hypothetical protein